MNKNGIRGIGLGMTGSGVIIAALSMIVDNSYWLILTGTAFFLTGLYVYLVKGR